MTMIIVRKCDVCKKPKEKEELESGLVIEDASEEKNLIVREVCQGCITKIINFMSELGWEK